MSDLDPQNAVDRLQTFSVNYSLNGPFSATARFADPACVEFNEYQECDFDLCGRPIQLFVDATLQTGECCLDENGQQTISQSIIDCYDMGQDFADSPAWVNGLVNSYQRKNKDGCSEIGITSYYDWLTRKPINSDHFVEDVNISGGAGTVLTQLATFYGGVPSNFLNIVSIDPNPVQGPAEGNNTLSELSLIAQAGCAYLFVQVGGQLTVEKWKDHTYTAPDGSDVDFEIPNVISAEPAGYTVPYSSVIRVRGGQFDTNNCGSQNLSDGSNGTGVTKKCFFSGHESPCVNFTFNNNKGDKEDIENAQLFSNGCFNTLQPKQNISSGTFDAALPVLGGSISRYTQACCDFVVQGSVQDDAANNRSFSTSAGRNRSEWRGSYIDAFFQRARSQFPVPYYGIGGGVFGNDFYSSSARSAFYTGNGTVDFYADQPARGECQLLAFDRTRIDSDCGVTVQEISNKYVNCKDILFKIAIRRFEEERLAQNTWNVEIPYTPCIRLNQMVRFEVPQESEDCPVVTIRGIVGGIALNNSNDPDNPCTTMRLAISDVSCLGQTPYTSGNVLDPICGGDNPDNPWLTSLLNTEQSAVADSELKLYVFGNGSAEVVYTPRCESTTLAGTTILDPTRTTESIQFDYTLEQGFGNLLFQGTPLSTLLGQTSTQVETVFTTGTLTWSLSPATNTGGGPLCYTISNISKTITYT